MSTVADNLERIRSQLGDARLIAVSKTHGVDKIREAYEAGQRDFGESYAQELRDKAPLLPDDIRWHFIGQIQSNKLKYIAPHAYRVHGITKLKYATELASRHPGIAGMINVNLGHEDSKVGVPPEHALELAAQVHAVEGFELVGLMCIPPFTDEPEGATPYFDRLVALAARGREQGLPLNELSMGMSRDWPWAIERGATWVRVGTAIFGPRESHV